MKALATMRACPSDARRLDAACVPRRFRSPPPSRVTLPKSRVDFADKERKANSRPDVREAALLPAESGEIAIIPHQAEARELIRRVTTGRRRRSYAPLSTHKSTRLHPNRGRIEIFKMEGATQVCSVRSLKSLEPGHRMIQALQRAKRPAEYR